MINETTQDIQRQRDEFFRRTRKPIVALYLFLGVAALGPGTYAVVTDTRRGSLGVVAGMLGILSLFLLGLLAPMSARASRGILIVLLPLSVVAAMVWGDSIDLTPLVFGVYAGSMAGAVMGLAALRHRLAADDELWLRQKRLGFDPERPFDWIRGGSKGSGDRSR